MLPSKKRARAYNGDDITATTTTTSSNSSNSNSDSSLIHQNSQLPFSLYSSNNSSNSSSFSTTFMASTYVSSQLPSVANFEGSLSLNSADTQSSNNLYRKQRTSVKQVFANVPESKSMELIPLSSVLPFTCSITCNQHISYQLLQWDLGQQEKNFRQSELDKLDTVLNQNSTLSITCVFLMNGLNNILEYPDWITDNLAKLMENCGFSLVEKNSSDVEQHLQQTSIFKIGKAFVTTPLSYILDRQAPHAVLNKLEIVFDFGSNGQSKEFVTNWKRKFHVDTISEYMEYALNLILLKKTFYMYPLIFSSFYAKKLSQTSAYLPHIAQSLQKIYITSKSTMSVSNHEFSESMLQKLKVIRKNVEIMCPSQSMVDSVSSTDSDEEDKTEDIDSLEKQNNSPQMTENMFSTYLTLAMYQSIKKENKPKMSTAKIYSYEPPNALCTIAQLWSVTCSTTSSSD